MLVQPLRIGLSRREGSLAGQHTYLSGHKRLPLQFSCDAIFCSDHRSTMCLWHHRNWRLDFPVAVIGLVIQPAYRGPKED